MILNLVIIYISVSIIIGLTAFVVLIIKKECWDAEVEAIKAKAKEEEKKEPSRIEYCLVNRTSQANLAEDFWDGVKVTRVDDRVKGDLVGLLVQAHSLSYLVNLFEIYKKGIELDLTFGYFKEYRDCMEEPYYVRKFRGVIETICDSYVDDHRVAIIVSLTTDELIED